MKQLIIIMMLILASCCDNQRTKVTYVIYYPDGNDTQVAEVLHPKVWSRKGTNYLSHGLDENFVSSTCPIKIIDKK